MGKLMGLVPMETHKATGRYVYTGQPVEKLGGSQYTLVTLALDMSPSIEEYVPDMEAMCQEVIKACQKDPNSEAIMMRFIGFHEDVVELQGFTELRHYDPAQFNNVIKISRATALNQATMNAVISTAEYGKQLVNGDNMCNGVLFIITDGRDNMGGVTPSEISNAIKDIRKDEGAETVESINTILIAASDDSYVVSSIKKFHQEAGLSQLVEMGEATANNLAKLGQFVSQSVSSTSQALGSGGPSQPLTF